MLYALHLLAAIALLLQSFSFVGGFLDMGQHISHQCLLQPLPDAVHQLLLFPTHQHHKEPLQRAIAAEATSQRVFNCVESLLLE